MYFGELNALNRQTHFNSNQRYTCTSFNGHFIVKNKINQCDYFRNGMLSTDQGLASVEDRLEFSRHYSYLNSTQNRFDPSPVTGNLGMKTWRGLSRRTLRVDSSVRWSSTTQKPANIASLLKSSAENDEETSPEIEVNGYVRTIRKQKRIAFAAVGDGSSLQPVQAVLTPDQALSYVQTSNYQ